MTNNRGLSRKLVLPVLLMVIGFSFTCSYAGNMEDGVAAYDKGNYKTAYPFFLAEAEKGNARAQYHLGTMYHNGAGVLQDYNEAAKWWRLAADQGDATAMCNLAEMYSAGVGIKKDLATAKKFAKEGFDAGNKYCQKLWDEYNLSNY